MKRNRKNVFALFLAMVLAVTPVSYIHAEEESEESVPVVLAETEDSMTESTTESGKPEDVDVKPEDTDVKPEDADVELEDAKKESEDIVTMSEGQENEKNQEKLEKPEKTLTEAETKSDGVESDFGMFTIKESTIETDGEKLLVTIRTSSGSYNKIYIGKKEDETKEPVIEGSANEYGGFTFQFELPVSARGTKVSFVPCNLKNGEWYVKKDIYLTIPYEETEPDPTPEPTPEPGEIRDGDYNVNVESSSPMFKVVKCVLTSKEEKMSAVITLSGTGYDKLFMGTAEDAVKAEETEFISYIADTEGKYTFTLPVSALDTKIAVAAHSVAKDLWYDRMLTFKSEGMEKAENGGNVSEKPDGKPDKNPGGSDSGKHQQNTTERPDRESKYDSDLFGATGRVNSATTLADGVYTPDRFSWSGGSGRVGITCNKITVTGGQAYATIVFSSSSYAYVKANGNIYYPTIQGDTSIFVIPVELNKNNGIIGMTTRMSEAHEIRYSIFVYLAAAAKADGMNVSSISDYTKLDEEAPKILGLEFESETQIDYAEYFKIYNYEQGITLLEIEMGRKTALGTEKDSADPMDLAELYKGNVVKYLFVPKDAEIPAGLEKEVIVVRQPCEAAYVASDEVLSVMDKLGAVDQIAAVGYEEKDIKIESIAKAMKEDKIAYAGAFDKTDMKRILKRKCDLAILPSEVLPQEENEEKLSEEKKTERLYEMIEKYVLLDIPVLIDRSSDEKEELARKEWVKVYGAMFGCTDKAVDVFDAIVAEKE